MSSSWLMSWPSDTMMPWFMHCAQLLNSQEQAALAHLGPAIDWLQTQVTWSRLVVFTMGLRWLCHLLAMRDEYLALKFVGNIPRMQVVLERMTSSSKSTQCRLAHDLADLTAMYTSAALRQRQWLIVRGVNYTLRFALRAWFWSSGAAGAAWSTLATTFEALLRIACWQPADLAEVHSAWNLMLVMAASGAATAVFVALHRALHAALFQHALASHAERFAAAHRDLKLPTVTTLQLWCDLTRLICGQFRIWLMAMLVLFTHVRAMVDGTSVVQSTLSSNIMFTMLSLFIHGEFGSAVKWIRVGVYPHPHELKTTSKPANSPAAGDHACAVESRGYIWIWMVCFCVVVMGLHQMIMCVAILSVPEAAPALGFRVRATDTESEVVVAARTTMVYCLLVPKLMSSMAWIHSSMLAYIVQQNDVPAHLEADVCALDTSIFRDLYTLMQDVKLMGRIHATYRDRAFKHEFLLDRHGAVDRCVAEEVALGVTTNYSFMEQLNV